ncbi:OB-fold domain-containing protein [Streptomyces sp. NPDC048385]|uniref:thiolase C-terminal domain-containing protein n=1 Tax=Streptomyces sp. NPDC048385 TaxID=3155145 RepID=UPI003440E6AF
MNSAPHAARPQPQTTQETEFFWTSGRDGRLRFQACTGCQALIHPPQPICRHCRSHDTTVRGVSGRARLIGFTVNHRFPFPGLPTPFIVAQVAVEEDPRVRLTTNLIDCAAEDLHLGMQMEVVFEQAGETWLPLFRPSTEQPDQATVPFDEPETHGPPALTPSRKFEDRAVISGAGASRMGRRLMVPPLELTVEACEMAVADAGLTLDDIDGLSTYPGAGSYAGFSEGGVNALEAALRIRPVWHSGAMETTGPGGAVISAMLAVAAGLARHVLCFRTVWESTHGELVKQGRIRLPKPAGADGWFKPFGAVSPAMVLAMGAQRHMHRYGTTRETLGWIALNQRANAARHPDAIYRDPLTMDDYLSARPIATPFGRYDCDVPCDAAVAVVVSAAETAGDLPAPPVRIEAVGTRMTEPPEWDQASLTHEPQVLGQAAHLWTRTQLRPTDVDVALLYDGFTYNCLSWIEALGFCGIGEARDFLDGGKNIAPDGILPLNPHGGQLSHGRTHGMGLLHEAVLQLRGRADARQVAGARTAVVSSGGLTPSGVLLLRTDA